MSSPELSFRPGLLTDWPAASRIVSKTWDNKDYIDGKLWRTWMDDPHARLIVAEINNTIAGFSRLSRLGEGEWWLESARVAPETETLETAHALTGYMIDTFTEIGDGILRLIVYGQDAAAREVARSFRFINILSYAPADLFAAADLPVGSFMRLAAGQLEMIQRYLRYSPMYRINAFMEEQWVLYYLNEDRLSMLFDDPEMQVLGWRQLEQLQGVAIVSARQAGTKSLEDALYLHYIDAADDTTLRSMLDALCGLAARRSKLRVTWKMPLSLGVEKQLADYPMHFPWQGNFILYERPIQRPSIQF